MPYRDNDQVRAVADPVAVIVREVPFYLEQVGGAVALEPCDPLTRHREYRYLDAQGVCGGEDLERVGSPEGLWKVEAGRIVEDDPDEVGGLAPVPSLIGGDRPEFVRSQKGIENKAEIVYEKRLGSGDRVAPRRSEGPDRVRAQRYSPDARLGDVNG